MFDYTSRIDSAKTVVCTPDIFENVVRSTKVAVNCEKIAKLQKKKKAGRITQEYFDEQKKKIKRELPAFLFHATYTDHHRHNVSAKPSGLSIYDIDHIDNPCDYWTKIHPRAKELGIVLAHVSPSCEGLRLVFIVPKGMNLPEAQQWLCNEINLGEYDDACKDYARGSFAVPESYILYIDKEALFANHSPLQDEEDSQVESQEDSQDDSPKDEMPATPVEDKPTAPTTEVNQTDSEVSPSPTPLSLRIFDIAMREVGITQADFKRVGMRHNFMVMLLSVGIPRLMSEDEMRKCIALRAPGFAGESDCQQLVTDWYKKYNDPNRPMSHRLEKIINEARNAENPAAGDSATDEPSFHLDIEAMPRALRDTLITIPEERRMPVLIAVLPLAASYADAVEFEHIDGSPSRMGLMSFIVGPQASGKSACTRMVDQWLTPMLEADQQQREREDAWRVNNEFKSDDKKEPFPHGPIRCVPVTISNSQFVDRSLDAEGHCLFSFTEEADTLISSNGAGAWSEKYDIYRLSTDNGRYGMDYKNDRTRSRLINVYYNMTLLGTYGAFYRCFNNANIENGLSSRFMIAELPDNSFAPLMRYKPITDAMKNNINEGIVRLTQAKGHFNVRRLSKMMCEWSAEKLYEADIADDRVMDIYRRRSALLGMRCGVVFSILEGKESDRVLNLTRTVTDYIFYEQCKLYGRQMKDIVDSSNRNVYRTSNNKILNKLPSTFTIRDLAPLRPDCDNDYLRVMVSRWARRGYIARVSHGQYKKLKKKY